MTRQVPAYILYIFMTTLLYPQLYNFCIYLLNDTRKYYTLRVRHRKGLLLCFFRLMTVLTRQSIFAEMCPHAAQLMADVHGSFVIQQLFKIGTDAQMQVCRVVYCRNLSECVRTYFISE